MLLLSGGGYQAHYRGDDAIINDVLIEEGLMPMVPVPVPVPVPVAVQAGGAAVAEMQDAWPVPGADQAPIGAPWMGLYVAA